MKVYRKVDDSNANVKHGWDNVEEDGREEGGDGGGAAVDHAEYLARLSLEMVAQ